MMQINANTRLNKLFKYNPDALEAIVSLNGKFEKLRNPFLRKLMAPRTTISMAAKIGGCAITNFFEVLEPLGFTADSEAATEEEVAQKRKDLPKVDTAHVLDARPLLSAGEDPLRRIMSLASAIKDNQTFCIINSFEPTPLIDLLSKQGFEAVLVKNGELEFHTYFTRITACGAPANIDNKNWNIAEEKFKAHCRFVDVRKMSAPLPMVTILEELKELPNGYALHVHHKRIPVHLFSEIKDRGYDYALREEGANNVHLLIFPAA